MWRARLILLLLVLFAGLFLWNKYAPDDLLRGSQGGTTATGDTIVAVMDVGQALSVVVVTGDGHSLVYDAGNAANDVDDVILPFLRDHGVDRLSYVVLSHPDQDHVGGMAALLDSIPVDTFVDPVIETTNRAYLRALETVDERGIHALRARRGLTLDLGPTLSAEVLWPVDPLMTDEDGEVNDNNNSVVIHLTDGDDSFLLTGDIEEPAEEALVDLDGNELHADVLQVGHHGSHTSSSEAFLSAVDPEVAIISAGAGNSYGHPHREVIDRLRAHDVAIYRTDQDGTIVAESDGSDVRVGLHGSLP